MTSEAVRRLIATIECVGTFLGDEDAQALTNEAMTRASRNAKQRRVDVERGRAERDDLGGREPA